MKWLSAVGVGFGGLLLTVCIAVPLSILAASAFPTEAVALRMVVSFVIGAIVGTVVGRLTGQVLVKILFD